MPIRYDGSELYSVRRRYGRHRPEQERMSPVAHKERSARVNESDQDQRTATKVKECNERSKLLLIVDGS